LRESDIKRNEKKEMDNKKIRWENDTNIYAKGEFSWHYSGYINDGVCVFELYEKRIGKYLYYKFNKKVYPVSTKEHGEELSIKILKGENPDKIKMELPKYNTKPSPQLSLPLNLPTTKKKKDTTEIENRLKL
jgi:hypothetical protein